VSANARQPRHILGEHRGKAGCRALALAVESLHPPRCIHILIRTTHTRTTHTHTHTYTHTQHTHTHTHARARAHSYLEGTMIDWARGEWYAEVKDGTPQGAKADPWKG
jgi:hypothetical protein